MVCSVILLYSMLNVFSPLISALNDIIYVGQISEEPSADTEYEELIITETGNYICIAVKELISEKFEIPYSDISVTALMEENESDGKIRLEHIDISLASEPSFQLEVISDTVSQQLMCECYVSVTESEIKE